MAVEVVRLLRLPGDCRALVCEQVAELGERMGEMKRLDAEPDPVRQPVRCPPSHSLGGSPAQMRGYVGGA